MMIILLFQINNRKRYRKSKLQIRDHWHSGVQVDVSWGFAYRKKGKSQTDENKNSHGFEPPKILEKYDSSDENIVKHKV